jgi:hypothetical protein
VQNKSITNEFGVSKLPVDESFGDIGIRQKIGTNKIQNF